MTAVAVLLLLALTATLAVLSPTGQRLLGLDRCLVSGPGGDHKLTPTQIDNARLIVDVAEQRDLPPRAAEIALATAKQESKLYNLNHGDRDSLGLFQQRPSVKATDGSPFWGTAAQVRDPEHAAGRFYDELVKVPGWQTKPLTEVAQAVQRSAFPNAYAQWEDLAVSLTAAIQGTDGATITCPN